MQGNIRSVIKILWLLFYQYPYKAIRLRHTYPSPGYLDFSNTLFSSALSETPDPDVGRIVTGVICGGPAKYPKL